MLLLETNFENLFTTVMRSNICFFNPFYSLNPLDPRSYYFNPLNPCSYLF